MGEVAVTAYGAGADEAALLQCRPLTRTDESAPVQAKPLAAARRCSNDEKNKKSHRARAVQKLRPALEALIDSRLSTVARVVGSK